MVQTRSAYRSSVAVPATAVGETQAVGEGRTKKRPASPRPRPDSKRPAEQPRQAHARRVTPGTCATFLEIQKALHASPRPDGFNSERFFKRGPGDYAEDDIFLNLPMPCVRSIARQYRDELSYERIRFFLKSAIHEDRLLGAVALVNKYEQAPKEVYDFYLKNRGGFNNWDIIDISCAHVVGKYLISTYEPDDPSDHDQVPQKAGDGQQSWAIPPSFKVLEDLAQSTSLWDNRIAIVSTLAFIRRKHFSTTMYLIIQYLKSHPHDLIHKACGWMLREVHRRESDLLERFLNIWAHEIPRTTLRYCVERMSAAKKTLYLNRLSK